MSTSKPRAETPEPLLSPRSNSWVAQLHTPTAGLSPRSALKVSPSSSGLTKAHEARLQWEQKNLQSAADERHKNMERRQQKAMIDNAHASRGRSRSRAASNQMIMANREVEHVKATNREHGGQVKSQLNHGRQRALEAREAWAADVSDRARQFGSARELRQGTGQSRFIQRSRSADQLRKTQMAEEIKQDSARLTEDLKSMRTSSARQSRLDAGTRRSSSHYGVTSARAGALERTQHIASTTQLEVGLWHRERASFEEGYLAFAVSSRREVERTRRRLRAARDATLAARAANADAVRYSRQVVDHERQRRMEDEAQSRRALHDRIARAKMAAPMSAR